MNWRRPSPKQLQSKCDAFAKRYSVGDLIRVWPGARNNGEPKEVTIVKPGAYVLGGHTAVVQVSGGHGCIALDHVAGKVE